MRTSKEQGSPLLRAHVYDDTVAVGDEVCCGVGARVGAVGDEVGDCVGCTERCDGSGGEVGIASGAEVGTTVGETVARCTAISITQVASTAGSVTGVSASAIRLYI
jgi:hypothetical protein